MNINDIEKKAIHLFAADPQTIRITAPWDAMLVPTEEWDALKAEVAMLKDRIKELEEFIFLTTQDKELVEKARELLARGEKK